MQHRNNVMLPLDSALDTRQADKAALPENAIMRRIRLVFGVVFTVVLAAATFASFSKAQATTYGFTFVSTPDDGFFGTAFGTFDTNSSGLVTSLTGTQTVGESATAYSMTLLGPGDFASNDNLFSPTSPYFDFSGISWVADGVDFNLGGGYYEDSANGFETDVSIAISQTPLPAGLPLFAFGLGAIGLFGWRRKREAQVIAA